MVGQDRFRRTQSWKKWSGRVRGHEDYHYGDVRRGVCKAIWSTIPWSRTADTRGDPDILNALSLGRMGLEIVEQGCESVRQHGFASDAHATLETILSAMATIRSALDELESRSDLASRGTPSSVCGKIMQMQMCTARTHRDWTIGQLVIGRAGLFFDSKAESSCIGPALWEDVEKLELFSDGDIALRIKGQSRTYMLSGVSNLEWLERLGSLRSVTPAADADSDSFCSAVEDAEDLHMWLADLASPNEGALDVDGYCGLSRAAESFYSAQITGRTISDAVVTRFSSGSAKSRKAACITNFTASFNKAVAELPAAEPPEKAKPVHSEKLADVSIEFIRKALGGDQEEWPPQLYLQQELRAHDFTITPWSDGQKVSGTKVRRLRFQMPVPADVPQAVKQLVKLPDETAATVLARIGSTDDVVVLLQETVSHDVAYGNNFIAQEILRFQRNAEGGVDFDKYVEIRWVIALPWYARIVGTFVEMKAKSDGKSSAEFMARYLKHQASLLGK